MEPVTLLMFNYVTLRCQTYVYISTTVVSLASISNPVYFTACEAVIIQADYFCVLTQKYSRIVQSKCSVELEPALRTG
jgi:hypothetical protein